MAVTSDAFTASDLTAVINEVWTPIVLEELFPKTVFANFFRDLSEFGEEGGDTFHVPDVFTNSFSIQTQSTQGAEVTTESVSQNDIKLSVDTHEYIAILIGDKDMRQIARGIYSINEIYSRKIGKTVRNSLESSIAGLWSGLSQSQGNTSTALKDADLRQSVSTLTSNEFELNDLGWFFHPDVLWHQIMGMLMPESVKFGGSPNS